MISNKHAFPLFQKASPQNLILTKKLIYFLRQTSKPITQIKRSNNEPLVLPNKFGQYTLSKKFSGQTAAAIIEFPNNKILLIKRGTTVFRGYWALPGGKVEAGETVEEAIVREIKEETGLTVEILKKIGEYHESGVNNGIEYDYYPTCFLVKVVEGKIERQKEEIEQIRLFKLDEIPRRLAFKHLDMLKDYKKNRLINTS
jgi:mutator protein MutT